jgi:hypothetical protein
MKSLVHIKRIWAFALILVGVGAVIGLGVQLLPRPDETAEINVTQAYETVGARLTQAQQTSPVTESPAAEATVPATSTAIPSPTRTFPAGDQTAFTASPSPTPPCDRAAAGNPMDVTIPDNTALRPRQSFTKVWRLLNAGECTWTRDYAARFFYGAQMDAPEVVYLGQEVPPGGEVEVAVDLVAPNEAGDYQGNWKLSNAEGYLFGIGPRGDLPFWVRITVIQVATATPTHTSTPTPTVTQTPTTTPIVTSTATATPTATAYSQGTLQANPAQSIDLDSGSLDPVEGADLNYALDGGFHLLAAQNGAALGVFGPAEPGQAACESAVMSGAPLALDSLTPGTYLCVRTDALRPAWLRYVSLNSETGMLDLMYFTWDGSGAP